jgi:hypothetical protein
MVTGNRCINLNKIYKAMNAAPGNKKTINPSELFRIESEPDSQVISVTQGYFCTLKYRK